MSFLLDTSSFGQVDDTEELYKRSIDLGFNMPNKSQKKITGEYAEKGRMRIDGKYKPNLWHYEKGESKTIDSLLNLMKTVYPSRLYPHINSANKDNGTSIDMKEWVRSEMVSPGLAYVPGRAGSTSGVTFADGIDIGQGDPEQYVKNLVEDGVSKELIDKIRPFVGLQGEQASAALKMYNIMNGIPFQLTWDESIELSKSYHKRKIAEIKTEFNANQPAGFRFNDLSYEWQTAYYSMRGNGLKLTSDFVRQVRERDFEAAKNNLADFQSPDSRQNDRALEVLEYIKKEEKLRNMRFKEVDLGI